MIKRVPADIADIVYRRPPSRIRPQMVELTGSAPVSRTQLSLGLALYECVSAFADQVHDGPVALPYLHIVQVEPHEFRPPQSAAEQHR